MERRSDEFKAQRSLFSLLRDPVVLKLHPELRFIHAYPAGRVFADKTARGKAKAEGMQTGVPDIAIPIARLGFYGLFIEMKSPTGQLSDDQRDFLEFLTKGKYKTAVCRSTAEALELIEWYLGYKIGGR